MDNTVLAVVTIVIGIALALVARAIVKWLEKYAETTETQWDDIIIAAIGTPVQVGIVVIALFTAVKYEGVVPAQYAWVISDKVLNSVYILLGTWIVSSLVHDIIVIYGHWWAEQTEGDLDDRIIEFLELAARYVIWFAGIMLILVNLEVNITPFLAGAGIAGLAFALAAQDLISNFFGGAIITVDKPFKEGDRIRIDNYLGDVIGVGPRSTRIRTLDSQIVTIPNNKITSSFIVNYAQPDEKLKITIPVSVAYGSDIEKVKRILLEIAADAIEKTGYILADPAPSVFLTELGGSGMNLILYAWARKYNLPDEVKDAINSRIIVRFAAEGIEIPFPQMEVRMRR
ncbi:MAG TPA: mechanosensitive ion channel family protein [Methanoregula sp.]|nr:mechanosensitive ion channel family protein [Methanoregula sp.]